MSDMNVRTNNASSEAKKRRRVAYSDSNYVYLEISDEEMEKMLRRPGAKKLTGEKKPVSSVTNSNVKSNVRREERSVARPVERSMERRVPERRPSYNPPVKEASRGNSSRTKRVEKRKKLPIFWVCLGAYAIILIILSAIFLNYTDRCLAQYEEAQPEHAMDTFLEEVKTQLADGSIVSRLTLPAGGGVFEDVNFFGQKFLNDYQGAAVYTYEKDAASYDTAAPIYDLYADGKLMAKMNLASSNERTIFGILTIMDWSVASIEPVVSADTKSYTIQVPSTYGVTVNGISLGSEYQISNEENKDYANVAEYATMPNNVCYQVNGLFEEPSINLIAPDGSAIPAAIVDGKVEADLASLSTETIPDDRREMVFTIAKTWEDFLTKDLTGQSYGLSTVRQYLVKDSYYWNLATSYAGGVDITFMSAHTVDGYTDPIIDEYVVYSDTCFSCHINYVKNMTLTRTSEKSTDTIDSTFYFVYYDDSDDGVDNPHWAMVDMIAKTN